MSDAPRWADTAAAIESGDFTRLAAAAESAVARIIEIGSERDAHAAHAFELARRVAQLSALHDACMTTHTRNPLSRYDVIHLRRILADADELVAGVYGGEDE